MFIAKKKKKERKKQYVHKNTRVRMSLAALYKIGKNWNNDDHLSINRERDKLWYIHTMEMLLSNEKGINHWYKQQYEWILKPLGWAKEGKHKRIYTALYDLYEGPKHMQLLHAESNQKVAKSGGGRMDWQRRGRKELPGAMKVFQSCFT